MTLRFRDERGRFGRVTDSLEVEYTGPWEQDVRAVVAAVREEQEADELGESTDPMSFLVFALPEHAPIVEVRREESQLGAVPTGRQFER